MTPETPQTAAPTAGAACSITEPCDTDCCADRPAPAEAPPDRQGWKALLFGALCLAGCLAGPLFAGGLAAASGAISGKVVVGLLVAAAIIGAALVRRARRGRPIC